MSGQMGLRMTGSSFKAIDRVKEDGNLAKRAATNTQDNTKKTKSMGRANTPGSTAASTMGSSPKT